MITVKGLKKVYKSYERGNSFKEIVKSVFVRETKMVEALKGIDFNIEEGELIGFLGPNGAGKSTTLKILTGILYPSEGEVRALGYDPLKERKQYVQNIGAVFGQKSQLIWDIPPIDSFYMNKAIYSIDNSDFVKRKDRLVDMLDLKDLIKKPTRQLSLGERMKCEFIMAMLHNPKIVFLDEPTIGLDVVAKEKIREFITEMNKNGTTFILTTHDLDDVESLAKRILVINGGELVFDNSLASLKQQVGGEKNIKIQTNHKIDDIEMMIDEKDYKINTLSEYEFEVKVNMADTPIHEFLANINKGGYIKDISIENPSIENIIRELYIQ